MHVEMEPSRRRTSYPYPIHTVYRPSAVNRVFSSQKKYSFDHRKLIMCSQKNFLKRKVSIRIKFFTGFDGLM